LGDGPLTGTIKNSLRAYRSKVDEKTKISKDIVGGRLKLSLLTVSGPSPRFIKWAEGHVRSLLF
jgi:hypothetical protein